MEEAYARGKRWQNIQINDKPMPDRLGQFVFSSAEAMIQH